ncbi:MAG: 50S ribosomal protein L21 [Candidatus Eisenbacteria bacterium]|nr:50S ribosomal protein L21 [Candidatus Eisenbacteria bacterium]
MHAIVEFQGRQYRVQPGEKLRVPHLAAEPGSTISIDRVLLFQGDAGVRVGSPLLEGARIEAKVLGHVRGPKVIVGKFKKRKDYRRRNGYRDDLTEVEIGAFQGV